MKKLLIGMTVLASIAAHASGNVRTFEDPKINKVSFSSESSPNIVCKYLGYETAVSTRLESFHFASAVTVRESGISGADFSTAQERISLIDRITCKNKLQENVDIAVPVLVKDPTFKQLRSLISRKSNETGVCRSLGYEKSAGGTLGSMVHLGRRGGLPIISSDGEIDSEEFESGDYIKKIICI